MSAGHDNGAGGTSPASACEGFDATKDEAPTENEKGFQFRAETDLGNIATKAEKEFLEANRPTPECGLHLTPDSSMESSVKQEVNLEQERRIQMIRNSLNQAQDRLRNDFPKSGRPHSGKTMDRGHER